MNKFSFPFLLTIALGAAACSSKIDPVPTCSGTCVSYVGITSTPSLSKDVIPILQNSCALSASCHKMNPSDNATSPQEDLNLGTGTNCASGKCIPLTMTPAEISTMYMGLVNATSKRSTLKMVVPGDPAASWLMAKISYTNLCNCAAVAGSCKPKGCGVQMPSNSPPLEQARIDVIAGWIKAGAKDD